MFCLLQGAARFANDKILFAIGFLGCLVAEILSFIDIIKKEKSSNIKILITIFGGIVLIMACVYLLIQSKLLISRLFYSLGIIFFSIGTIKGIGKFKKHD